MLKIIICEDNIEQLFSLEQYIKNIISENELECELSCVAESPDQVLEYLALGEAQVFFLDIDFNNNISGLELSISIRKKIQNAYIVFISEQLKYVFNSFMVHPFDFLPKPITQNVLKKCLDEILIDHKFKNEDNSKITVKIGSLIKYVIKDDIIYIERLMGKTVIKFSDSEIKCYESLEHFEKLLCSEANFARCHRSYIFNRKHLCGINLKEMSLLMGNGDKCHIGRSYKKGVTL